MHNLYSIDTILARVEKCVDSYIIYNYQDWPSQENKIKLINIRVFINKTF